MESNSQQDENRIDDLEQEPVDATEAEKVKGGSGAQEPTLIRVPGPSLRKIDPCWIIPCV